MWKSHTTNKVLLITEWVQPIDSKEFVIAVLDADSKTFEMHVAIWKQEEMTINPDRKAKIEAQSRAQSEAQVRALIFNKAPSEVSAEYSNYSNVFSAENAADLPENTEMNEHTIKLEENKQPLFRPIYNLGPMESETLKTYIKTNLVNSFIRFSKSPAEAPILFDWKPNESFRFYMDYWDLKNITIKSRYPLPLIGKLLDWLDWVKRFTQFDLTNAYHQIRICKGDE